MSLKIDKHQLTFHNKSISSHFTFQRIVSDCPGLLNFAIGAGNFVLNLPDGHENVSGNSNYRSTARQIASTPDKFMWIENVFFFFSDLIHAYEVLELRSS